MAEMSGHRHPVTTARYIGTRFPSIASLFILMVGVVWAVGQADALLDRWQVSSIDRVDVFEYVSVEYVATTPDGLTMVSTAAWYRHADRIEWLDRLDCGGGTWSSQTIERADRAPEPLATVKWPYTAGHPTDGRECFMESVIAVEHRGRVFTQRVQSAPFTPGASP